jgi:hypothetical protein
MKAVQKIALHAVLILTLSALLTLSFDSVIAQVTTTVPTGAPKVSFLGPKLLVFIVAVIVSIITDGIAMGFLAGGFHPLRAIFSSIPWSFVNVYYWDFIAPFVSGYSFLNLKFFQVGNPAWGYWVGSNVIVAFLGNIIMEQAVFRFARGAAASPWSMDLALAGLDAVLPIILFMVLPSFGII